MPPLPIDFMASINCPHGHRSIARLGRSVVYENRLVNIFNGVCDSCDICGFQGCEYFDESPEGTLRYQQGQAERRSTIEGRSNDHLYQEQLRRKHRPREAS